MSARRAICKAGSRCRVAVHPDRRPGGRQRPCSRRPRARAQSRILTSDFPAVHEGPADGHLDAHGRRGGAGRETARRSWSRRRPARPDQTIRDLQTLLIDSTTQFVVVPTRRARVQGVITLHDLLRAQVQKAEARRDYD